MVSGTFYFGPINSYLCQYCSHTYRLLKDFIHLIIIFYAFALHYQSFILHYSFLFFSLFPGDISFIILFQRFFILTLYLQFVNANFFVYKNLMVSGTFFPPFFHSSFIESLFNIFLQFLGINS